MLQSTQQFCVTDVEQKRTVGNKSSSPGGNDLDIINLIHWQQVRGCSNQVHLFFKPWSH